MDKHNSSKRIAIELFIIVGLALAIRVFCLQFATTNSADPTTRIWNAWRWLSDPTIITHGVWGPLHYYLIAASMALVRDPIFPPILLHVLFGALTPVLLYFFTKKEFGGHRSSIIVAISYAFYPIAISNSLTARSETPFVFFLLLSFIFISSIRQNHGSWRHALGAGICLTLAGMLRYEGWMLIPLLGVLIWKKPKFMILFIASSMLHPIFWMIGNAIHHGDPLYFINWASNWELNLMGKTEYIAFTDLARRMSIFPIKTFRWITPLVSLISVLGVAVSIIRKEKQASWIIPFVGLIFLMSSSVARGNLVPKSSYTMTLGAIIIPFCATVYEYLGIEKLSIKGWVIVTAIIVSSMMVYSYPRFWNHLPLLSRVTPVSPIQQFPNQEKAKILARVIKENIGDKSEGFISDFYGWSPSYYVALMTGLPPDRIFMVTGAPHKHLNVEGLRKFLGQFPTGIILIHNDSRFSENIGFTESNQVRIDRNVVKLKKVQSLPWLKIKNKLLRASKRAEYSKAAFYISVSPILDPIKRFSPLHRFAE